MKDIKNYEGIYAVTEDGRVWSYRSKRFLAPQLAGKGYLKVELYKKGHKKASVFVHRLVAEAFIPNPDSLPEVNHKDEDKTNNNISNLEWITRQANVAYSNSKAIRCIELNRIFNSIIEAERALNLCHENICKVLKGKLAHTGGYHFEYVLER